MHPSSLFRARLGGHFLQEVFPTHLEIFFFKSAFKASFSSLPTSAHVKNFLSCEARSGREALSHCCFSLRVTLMVLSVCLISCLPEVGFAIFSSSVWLCGPQCTGGMCSAGWPQAHGPSNGVRETRPLFGAQGRGDAVGSVRRECAALSRFIICDREIAGSLTRG